MKYLLFAFALAFAAAPPVPEADPYAKVDLILNKANAQIARSQAAVSEMKALNAEIAIAKAEKVEEMKQEAEAMAQQLEIVDRVFEAYSIEMPGSIEEWVDDSLRTANMQEINKTK